MSYASEVLADSPTAYWPMTETSGDITDLVGSVVGTASGTPIYNIPNYINRGINMNTVGYFAKASAGANFTWVLGTDLTIEFCIKSAVDATTRAIMGYRTSTTANRQYSVFLLNGTNILFDVGGTNNRWTTNITISDSNWHHVILKHRGSDGHRELLIDGALKASGTVIPTTAETASGSLLIGHSATSTPVNGSLSDMAIYNGSYLSPARCAAHWLQIQNNASRFLSAQL